MEHTLTFYDKGQIISQTSSLALLIIFWKLMVIQMIYLSADIRSVFPVWYSACVSGQIVTTTAISASLLVINLEIQRN